MGAQKFTYFDGLFKMQADTAVIIQSNEIVLNEVKDSWQLSTTRADV